MWKQVKKAFRGQQPPQQPPEAESGNIKHIKRSALVYEKEIGHGGFSNVYQMKWESPNGPINVAVKKLTTKDTNELEVLSDLDHPNIVKLIGVVDEAMDFMLVLELCEGGSLRSYLQARNGLQMSAQQFYDWAEQVARPIEYLLEKHLVHKDVKSPNYLLTSQNTLKLADFGIAKNIDHTVSNATTTASYRWMAPELLVKFVLSPKFDIFALAVVLWELWTGRFPWEGVHGPTIIYKVCHENERLPIPEDSPEPFKDLLRQCWQTDWKQRPDITQVLHVITSLSKSSSEALLKAKARRLEAGEAGPLKAAAEAHTARQFIAGPWKMVKRFGQQDGPGKLVRAWHMTLSPDGDVVITDRDASQIKIYNIEGVYKSRIDTRSQPWQTVVSSDNTCYMTDWSQHITMHELGGKYKGSWVSNGPHTYSQAPELHGLAIDHAGDLLLGDIANEYLYRHKLDGTHVASIKVGIAPGYIAVTSQGLIVISAWDNTAPQIITSTGEVLHTLEHPAHESKWDPYNVYCHDGIIFVCCSKSLGSHSILGYNESGKYLGSMPISSIKPYGGIAITSDSKTLLICERTSVKVFSASLMQQ